MYKSNPASLRVASWYLHKEYVLVCDAMRFWKYKQFPTAQTSYVKVAEDSYQLAILDEISQ